MPTARGICIHREMRFNDVWGNTIYSSKEKTKISLTFIDRRDKKIAVSSYNGTVCSRESEDNTSAITTWREEADAQVYAARCRLQRGGKALLHAAQQCRGSGPVERSVRADTRPPAPSLGVTWWRGAWGQVVAQPLCACPGVVQRNSCEDTSTCDVGASGVRSGQVLVFIHLCAVQHYTRYLKYFFKLFIWREKNREQGRGRERKGERESQADFALSAQSSGSSP